MTSPRDSVSLAGLLIVTRSCGREPRTKESTPGAMSRTWWVPAKVPSLVPNSRPLRRLVATNKTPSQKATRLAGSAGASPAKMSRTSVVPASVPALIGDDVAELDERFSLRITGITAGGRGDRTARGGSAARLPGRIPAGG